MICRGGVKVRLSETARWREGFAGCKVAEIAALLEQRLQERYAQAGVHRVLAELDRTIMAGHQPATGTARCSGCQERWPCSHLYRICL